MALGAGIIRVFGIQAVRNLVCLDPVEGTTTTTQQEQYIIPILYWACLIAVLVGQLCAPCVDKAISTYNKAQTKTADQYAVVRDHLALRTGIIAQLARIYTGINAQLVEIDNGLPWWHAVELLVEAERLIQARSYVWPLSTEYKDSLFRAKDDTLWTDATKHLSLMQSRTSGPLADARTPTVTSPPEADRDAGAAASTGTSTSTPGPLLPAGCSVAVTPPCSTALATASPSSFSSTPLTSRPILVVPGATSSPAEEKTAVRSPVALAAHEGLTGATLRVTLLASTMERHQPAIRIFLSQGHATHMDTSLLWRHRILVLQMHREDSVRHVLRSLEAVLVALATYEAAAFVLLRAARCLAPRWPVEPWMDAWIREARTVDEAPSRSEARALLTQWKGADDIRHCASLADDTATSPSTPPAVAFLSTQLPLDFLTMVWTKGPTATSQLHLEEMLGARLRGAMDELCQMAASGKLASEALVTL